MMFEKERSVKGCEWLLAPLDERYAAAVKQTYNLSDCIAAYLHRQTIAFDDIPAYLSPTLRYFLPDPLILKDMARAVERFIVALEKNEKLVVYGDYDVDGATASALLRRYCATIGFPIDLYIPDRIEEGYGANAEALITLAKKGYQLVLMVDSGTTAFEPLTAACDQGLDVVVIDHHTAQVALPKAVAIINPHRLDQEKSSAIDMLQKLCAAGLAFLFVVAVQRALRDRGWFKEKGISEPDLMNLLDLVALGTVCDVMPLVGLNRAFVRQGLKVAKNRANLGLSTLSDIGGVNEALSAYHLGFVIGPRINAGGRVGKSTLGSLLLTTSDSTEALQLGHQLNLLNQERQDIEKFVLNQALEQVETLGLNERSVIMVAGKNWHPGVIGIVASRLKERFHKPCCVVSIEGDTGKGSGRSVAGASLGQAMHLALNKNLLEKGGGHAMAAGFTLSMGAYDAFYDFLETHFAALLKEQTPTLRIDHILRFSGVTAALFEELSLLEPFGAGNSAPRFAFKYVRCKYLDRMGQDHYRCTLVDEFDHTLEGVAFRSVGTALEEALRMACQSPIHVAGTLKRDTWRNQERFKLFIDDAMMLRP